MINYSKFVSLANHREPSYLASLRDMQHTPEKLVLMASGLPNPQIFPLLEGSFTMIGGDTLHITPQLMRNALQYGTTQGYNVLLDQLWDLTKRVHAPPHLDSRKVVLTMGNTHSLSLFINLLINPGDSVYIVDPSYCGIFPMFRCAKARLVGVPSDKEGMIPSSLSDAIASSAGTPSKFIYLNPTGSNPEGKTMSGERRRQIYNIASQHDLLIVEDDPFYFLHFSKETPCSFLNLDTEGRVIRLDSMSKIMSAGLRVGFATAPKSLADMIMDDISKTIMHTSMISQVVVSEVLKTWGHQGFMDHMRHSKLIYQTRRDTMVAAARKHLTGLCEWRVPDGGLFLWVKVLGMEDTRGLVEEQCLSRNLCVVPGCVFLSGENPSSPYIRLSYSTVAMEDMEKGCKILAVAIRAWLKSSEANQK